MFISRKQVYIFFCWAASVRDQVYLVVLQLSLSFVFTAITLCSPQASNSTAMGCSYAQRIICSAIRFSSIFLIHFRLLVVHISLCKNGTWLHALTHPPPVVVWWCFQPDAPQCPSLRHMCLTLAGRSFSVFPIPSTQENQALFCICSGSQVETVSFTLLNSRKPLFHIDEESCL